MHVLSPLEHSVGNAVLNLEGVSPLGVCLLTTYTFECMQLLTIQSTVLCHSLPTFYPLLFSIPPPLSSPPLFSLVPLLLPFSSLSSSHFSNFLPPLSSVSPPPSSLYA